MERSEIGDLVQNFWAENPGHFPFVELGEFVVMPDHFHGIIVINNNSNNPVEANRIENWKPGTIGVMINQFKRICTIHARKINPDFAWQSRYYDYIIRDDIAFYRISEYIRKNSNKAGSS